MQAFLQNRKQNKYQWKVASLDLVLGLVGGLAGVIWPTLYMIFGSYETFKFENSLIGAVYPTSPFGGKNDDDIKDDTESIADNRKYMVSLMRTIAERGKYWYNYSEYVCVWFLSKFCCCLF